ncbi:MAG: Gfo/Idh/MocA family protein [Anaerobacillus sp.]|uniref:Gfo/Idh/MocA family protein n=1 Tax=Anaerobacillus sp. TaxID=1872506 RepID=UPI003919E1E4
MKRYAFCGLSNRAFGMFIGPMLEKFASHSDIVGLLDLDPVRFDVLREQFPQLQHIPTYMPNEFEQMIEETKPDAIIVAGRDDTHVEYILKALELDLEVITEKPMVTTAHDAARIIEAESKSKGKVIVTFNYRYAPPHRKIKELILEGKIGRVTSIDLNWYIDTYHGASYFKRWNRVRESSGGLSVHKSTHHIDLINWWVDQTPVEAFAYGALNYYGPDGELNPSKKDSRYCGTCDEKIKCDYYMRWTNRTEETAADDDHVKPSFNMGTKYTNYRQDACIYDKEINIEDTYVATVKYDKGALLSYSINFSTPYEGYRLAINGTKGRIETTEFHEPSRIPFPHPAQQAVEYFPLFGSKETIHIVQNKGGHGGGDPLLLEDIFLGNDPRRNYDILAGAIAGGNSIAVGEAIWRSTKENRPIKIEEILSIHTSV